MKKGGMALFAIALVAVLLVSSYLILIEKSQSEKLIVQGNDLGPGWNIHGPENVVAGFFPTNGSIESTHVKIRNWTGDSAIYDDCCLHIFPSSDRANQSYQEVYNWYLHDNRNLTSVPYGDRAAIFSLDAKGQEAYNRVLLLQKGNIIVYMLFWTNGGPNISINDLMEIARIQADKIP